MNGRLEERDIEKICVSMDTTKILRIPEIVICSILYKGGKMDCKYSDVRPLRIL